jgi:hypothetical protein
MAVKTKTVRQDLGEVITEVFSREWLLDFANTVKGMTQGVWGEGRCPECDSARKVMVQIPDLKGQLAAVTSLLEQAEGRPGTAVGEVGGVSIVVERTWPSAGAEDQKQLLPAAEADPLPHL